MRYDTAIAMAKELAEKRYAEKFATGWGQPLRAAGVTPLVAGIIRTAGELEFKTPDDTIPLWHGSSPRVRENREYSTGKDSLGLSAFRRPFAESIILNTERIRSLLGRPVSDQVFAVVSLLAERRRPERYRNKANCSKSPNSCLGGRHLLFAL